MRHDAKTVTIDNKTYIVHPPRAYRVISDQVVVAYPYWSTRNGDYFGASRVATTQSKGKVGRQLVAAARELFNVDHDQMIAEWEERNR